MYVCDIRYLCLFLCFCAILWLCARADGGGVGYRLGVAEEPLEADPIRCLALKLGVAEHVPLLDHEELDHHHLVVVGSAALGSLVGVEALDYWSELLLADEVVCFGGSVAESADFLVGLVEDV